MKTITPIQKQVLDMIAGVPWVVPADQSDARVSDAIAALSACGYLEPAGKQFPSGSYPGGALCINDAGSRELGYLT